MTKFDEIVESLSKSDGGKGYIGQVEIGFAYKVFAQGHSNAETMFKIDNPQDDASVKEALERAKKWINDNGLTKIDGNGKEKPLSAFRVCYLIIFRDHVLVKQVKWKEDRVFTYMTWKPKDRSQTAFHDVFKPSLANAGIEDVGKYWAHVRFQVNPDPKAKKRLDDQGNEIDDFVAFIDCIYPNEALARKDAEELFADDESANVPDDGLIVPIGWSREDFIKYIPDIKKAIAGGKAPALVIKEWGIDEDILGSALSSKY